jgi:acyl-coenzyme A synthetase/AMP-(fatty) acid ligase
VEGKRLKVMPIIKNKVVEVMILDKLPATGTGKTKENELKKLYQTKLQEE